jgi:hypothetical protein
MRTDPRSRPRHRNRSVSDFGMLAATRGLGTAAAADDNRSGAWLRDPLQHARGLDECVRIQDARARAAAVRRVEAATPIVISYRPPTYGICRSATATSCSMRLQRGTTCPEPERNCAIRMCGSISTGGGGRVCKSQWKPRPRRPSAGTLVGIDEIAPGEQARPGPQVEGRSQSGSRDRRSARRAGHLAERILRRGQSGPKRSCFARVGSDVVTYCDGILG